MARNIDCISLQAVWGNSNFEFALKNSEGKLGGIISIWDPSKFTLQKSVDGDGFLAVLGTWHSPDTLCNIIVVYDPQCLLTKKKLWNDLRKLYMDFDSLTIIMGDFNKVRADTERLGTTFCHQGAINFNDFISSSGLFDLPLCGLSFKWRSWILACLRSSYTLVLINGLPTPEFNLERGLRQGDPLSLLLFILVVEALNVALLEARANNLFRGVKVGIDKINISHLQYADDALIMENSIWSKSIRSLHGPPGGLHDSSSIRSKSGPWCQIARLKEYLIPNGINLSDLFSKNIGNDESTKFWLDKWLGGSPLSESYPRLFRLDLNQHFLVCDRAPTAINTPSGAFVTVVVAPVLAPVTDLIIITVTTPVAA
nr:cytochrome P450 [Tanacetum cinerariifolium]